MRHRIYSLKNNALSADDRLEIVRLLVKAGYTVQLGREKKGNSSAYVYFVEFWEEE